MEYGIDPSEGDLVEKIIKLTGGLGADGVIITASASTSEMLAQAFQACRRKGRVVVVGDAALNIARSDIYAKELDFFISTSYGPGRYDSVYEEEGNDYPIAYVRWTENRNMSEYLRQLQSGRVNLQNMLRDPYDISEAETAYALLTGEGKKPLLVLLKYPERVEAQETTIRVADLTRAAKADDRIGVAVVGAGGFAQGVHLPNLAKLKRDYKLHSVVSRTGLSAHAAAQRYEIP